MKISIQQPNYLPWIGYFDKLDQSQCFVFLDKANRSHRSVINRNYILTPKGKLLLSVPIKKGKLKIHTIQIDNSSKWTAKHWGTIEANYKKTPFWNLYSQQFLEIYQREWEYLSELNINLIQVICEILEIDVKIYRESDFNEDFGTSSERIAKLVEKIGGTIYISGRGASAYNNHDDFTKRGIELFYQNFEHPSYSQKWGKEFTENCSIIDLIFNHGPESIDIIRSTRKELVKTLEV